MNKRLLAKLAALPAIAGATIGSAMAELPATVAPAVTEYQTDAGTAIGLMMGAGVIIWGLLKLKAKLGW